MVRASIEEGTRTTEPRTRGSPQGEVLCMDRKGKLGAALGAAGLLTVASVVSVVAQDLTPVSVQLQWVPQAQFAGYYAADALGFWEEQGLDVTLIDGGPDVVPQLVGSAPKGPEFTTSWVPKVLEVVDAGQSDLVNIAQVFQRSGPLSVSWADSPVASPADFAGKKVGVWDFGNEYEVTAAASEAGLEWEDGDYEKIIQPFDMS